MQTKTVQLLLLLLDGCILTQTASTKESATTYQAAVVEFNPVVPGQTSEERMAERLSRVDEHIRSLGSTHPDLDIVVFPESAIAGSVADALTIPAPLDRIVPCTNATYADTPLYTLSCAAQATSTYVVVNLFTKQECSPSIGNSSAQLSPSPDICVYNTNLVFNRCGALISSYRKYNVYSEPGVSSTLLPDLDTFTTDFGVTFGHTICFDILFDKPSVELVTRGVRNILHPCWWFGELPSLTSLQTQQGWAQANGVNLLVAGIARTSIGSTGSGIFSGVQGALGTGGWVSPVGANPADKVLVRTVPKVPLTQEEADAVKGEQNTNSINLNAPVTHVHMLRENITRFTWRPVNVTEAVVRHELCNDNQFCCAFEHQLVDSGARDNSTVAYEYIAAIYNGTRTFGGINIDHTVLSCSVIACRNNTDLDTCATLYPPAETLQQRYKFAALEVSGYFRSNATIIMPNTLAPAMMPLPTSMYNFTETEAVKQPWDGLHYQNVSMKLMDYDHTLLNFGVYGRDFGSSATTHTAAKLLMLAAALGNLIIS